MPAAVAEVLTHRSRSKRSEVLHGGGLGGGGGDDNGIRHRTILFKRLNNLRHRGPLLTNRAVDADQVVLRRVDDRVERNRSFAGLTVADQQFALAAADR